MNFVFPAIIVFFMNLWAVVPAWSHGVEGYTEKIQGYCITARYDDGEPMAYAAVEINAPQTEFAFQTGRADRNGCFTFLPDGQGLWQAIVTDGMGHRLALEVEVGGSEAALDTSSTSPSPASPPRELTRAFKVAAGLSIIFGVFGIVYGVTARRFANRVKAAS